MLTLVVGEGVAGDGPVGALGGVVVNLSVVPQVVTASRAAIHHSLVSRASTAPKRHNVPVAGSLRTVGQGREAGRIRNAVREHAEHVLAGRREVEALGGGCQLREIAVRRRGIERLLGGCGLGGRPRVYCAGRIVTAAGGPARASSGRRAEGVDLGIGWRGRVSTESRTTHRGASSTHHQPRW